MNSKLKELNMENTSLQSSFKPELLMPAGSLEKLKYAYAYGADAVYVGIPIFSLRARENDIDINELYEAKKIAQKLNKKLYITVNIFSKNRKLNIFRNNISELAKINPDAFIMSDPGLMMIAREMHPDINIHLSVQANCMNWESVRFWKQSLGVSRIILSRELHLNDIREIKQRVPDIELEAFVHGSICIAYSGRCLMSSYMSHRDANQGVCDNSCREKFKVYQTDKVADGDYYIEDLRSSGQLYQISEDENGSYLMNAKDLRLIEYLKDIYNAGVCSFKVEGRTKSINYVSQVAKAYRTAIDDFITGKSFNPQLCEDLEKVANRGYDTGFMVRENTDATSQNYDTSLPRKFTQKFAGVLIQDPDTPPEYFAIHIRNRIKLENKCEMILPSGSPFEFRIKSILNKDLIPVSEAHGGCGKYYIKSDQLFTDNYGILNLKEI